jgi:hypothetical protein
MPQLHIFEKYSIELFTSKRNQEPAKAQIQSNNEYLLQLIQEVLDEYIPSDKVIEVNQIKLHLGTIPSSDFLPQFSDRLKKILKRELQLFLQREDILGYFEAQQKELSFLQHFRNYLEQGFSVFFQQNGYFDPEQIWEQLWKEDPDAIKQLLRSFSSQDSAWKRLRYLHKHAPAEFADRISFPDSDVHQVVESDERLLLHFLHRYLTGSSDVYRMLGPEELENIVLRVVKDYPQVWRQVMAAVKQSEVSIGRLIELLTYEALSQSLHTFWSARMRTLLESIAQSLDRTVTSNWRNSFAAKRLLILAQEETPDFSHSLKVLLEQVAWEENRSASQLFQQLFQELKKNQDDNFLRNIRSYVTTETALLHSLPTPNRQNELEYVMQYLLTGVWRHPEETLEVSFRKVWLAQKQELLMRISDITSEEHAMARIAWQLDLTHVLEIVIYSIEQHASGFNKSWWRQFVTALVEESVSPHHRQTRKLIVCTFDFLRIHFGETWTETGLRDWFYTQTSQRDVDVLESVFKRIQLSDSPLAIFSQRALSDSHYVARGIVDFFSNEEFRHNLIQNFSQQEYLVLWNTWFQYPDLLCNAIIETPLTVEDWEFVLQKLSADYRERILKAALPFQYDYWSAIRRELILFTGQSQDFWSSQTEYARLMTLIQKSGGQISRYDLANFWLLQVLRFTTTASFSEWKITLEGKHGKAPDFLETHLALCWPSAANKVVEGPALDSLVEVNYSPALASINLLWYVFSEKKLPWWAPAMQASTLIDAGYWQRKVQEILRYSKSDFDSVMLVSADPEAFVTLFLQQLPEGKHREILQELFPMQAGFLNLLQRLLNELNIPVINQAQNSAPLTAAVYVYLSRHGSAFSAVHFLRWYFSQLAQKTFLDFSTLRNALQIFVMTSDKTKEEVYGFILELLQEHVVAIFEHTPEDAMDVVIPERTEVSVADHVRYYLRTLSLPPEDSVISRDQFFLEWKLWAKANFNTHKQWVNEAWTHPESRNRLLTGRDASLIGFLIGTFPRVSPDFTSQEMMIRDYLVERYSLDPDEVRFMSLVAILENIRTSEVHNLERYIHHLVRLLQDQLRSRAAQSFDNSHWEEELLRLVVPGFKLPLKSAQPEINSGSLLDPDRVFSSRIPEADKRWLLSLPSNRLEYADSLEEHIVHYVQVGTLSDSLLSISLEDFKARIEFELGKKSVNLELLLPWFHLPENRSRFEFLSPRLLLLLDKLYSVRSYSQDPLKSAEESVLVISSNAFVRPEVEALYSFQDILEYYFTTGQFPEFSLIRSESDLKVQVEEDLRLRHLDKISLLDLMISPEFKKRIKSLSSTLYQWLDETIRIADKKLHAPRGSEIEAEQKVELYLHWILQDSFPWWRIGATSEQVDSSMASELRNEVLHKHLALMMKKLQEARVEMPYMEKFLEDCSYADFLRLVALRFQELSGYVHVLWGVLIKSFGESALEQRDLLLSAYRYLYDHTSDFSSRIFSFLVFNRLISSLHMDRSEFQLKLATSIQKENGGDDFRFEIMQEILSEFMENSTAISLSIQETVFSEAEEVSPLSDTELLDEKFRLLRSYLMYGTLPISKFPVHSKQEFLYLLDELTVLQASRTRTLISELLYETSTLKSFIEQSDADIQEYVLYFLFDFRRSELIHWQSDFSRYFQYVYSFRSIKEVQLKLRYSFFYSVLHHGLHRLSHKLILDINLFEMAVLEAEELDLVVKRSIQFRSETSVDDSFQSAILVLEQELNLRISELVISGVESIVNNKRKLDIPQKLEGRLLIHNAGLVLAGPYLYRYFDRLEMLEGNQFKSETLAMRAVQLLQFMATGSAQTPEHEMVLNKIICGVSFDQVPEPDIELTETEIEVTESLMEGMLQHWEILKSKSIPALREGFLIRDGMLEETELCYTVEVDRKAQDLLVDHIPWGFSTIKLPWMVKSLNVVWKKDLY